MSCCASSLWHPHITQAASPCGMGLPVLGPLLLRSVRREWVLKLPGRPHWPGQVSPHDPQESQAAHTRDLLVRGKGIGLWVPPAVCPVQRRCPCGRLSVAVVGRAAAWNPWHVFLPWSCLGPGLLPPGPWLCLSVSGDLGQGVWPRVLTGGALAGLSALGFSMRLSEQKSPRPFSPKPPEIPKV